MNREMLGFPAALALFAMNVLWCRPAVAATTFLNASKDNTLYEDPAGMLSNGKGQYIFSGQTAFSNATRRALLAFDLSGIPPGSTITSAVLTLYLNMSISGDRPMSIHRVNASWGEGTSDPTGQEGGGATATLGDATWIHRFYAATPWATPGGEFDALPSATVVVSDSFGVWSWDSAGSAADVQAWVDDPSANHGWIVLGDETIDTTAKRFGSRENPDPAQRPGLTVEYTPPPPDGAGAVAESGASALRLARATGLDLTITWGGSSCTGDPDFEVYEGVLGNPLSHLPVTCTTSGATSATITPGPGDSFYLVVPRSALHEGSYGRRTGGIERPPSALACLPQSILACQ